MRALVLVIVGCGRVGFDATAGAIDGSRESGACAWTPFSMPAALPGPIQSAVDDWCPASTLGDTQMFFHSYRGSTLAKLWFATRPSTSVAFDPATKLAATDNLSSQQFAPTLTDDGSLLIYADSVGGGFSLYSTERAGGATFGPPAILANVNAGGGVDDNYPFVSGDGLDLVFSSTRTGATHSLWESVRPDRQSPFPTPKPIAELSPSGVEGWSPSLSADKLDIWFSSNRNAVGRLDVYTAHRAALDQPFGPAALVPELSSQGDDVGVRLTPDGATIYLNYGANTGGGNADIDVATRSCM